MLTLSGVQSRGHEAARAFTNKNRLSIVEFLQALECAIPSHARVCPVQATYVLTVCFKAEMQKLFRFSDFSYISDFQLLPAYLFLIVLASILYHHFLPFLLLPVLTARHA